MRACLALIWLLFAAGAAEAAQVTVSNPSELEAALGRAGAGDVILLASGRYGALTLRQAFAGEVTLRAAAPLGAVFTAVTFRGAGHVRLEGVKIEGPDNGAAGSMLLAILGSRNITIANCEIHGPVDSDYGGHFGIRVKDAGRVTVQDNFVHDVHVGMAFFGVEGLKVTGNWVDHLGSDGYKFGGVRGFLIENNEHGGHSHHAPKSHTDFMQFQGPMIDGIVRGNLYLAQTRTNVQGLFFSDKAVHRDVLIEQNIIYTGMANGITMKEGSGITVRHNTVLTVPNDRVKASFIKAPPGSLVEDNIYAFRRGDVSGSNIGLQYSNPRGAYYYGVLFANATRGLGITLADLRPVPGSLAETKGAHLRLRELLEMARP